MLDRRYATWAELKERKELRDAELRRGAIGEATYLLSLRILGYTDREARDEMASLK